MLVGPEESRGVDGFFKRLAPEAMREPEAKEVTKDSRLRLKEEILNPKTTGGTSSQVSCAEQKLSSPLYLPTTYFYLVAHTSLPNKYGSWTHPNRENDRGTSGFLSRCHHPEGERCLHVFFNLPINFSRTTKSLGKFIRESLVARCLTSNCTDLFCFSTARPAVWTEGQSENLSWINIFRKCIQNDCGDAQTWKEI